MAKYILLVTLTTSGNLRPLKHTIGKYKKGVCNKRASHRLWGYNFTKNCQISRIKAHKKEMYLLLYW